ncbi:MAG: UTP--glucose-1-phosphate uridylyltransferase [Clostridia bacterium]|nr:UTP--glucose-1-phosphate uridylyltransferase [Clostridia bacterium]
MDEDLQKIIPILKKYEQSHLINFYNELEDVEKQNLIKEIKETDFEFLDNLYINSFKNEIVDKKRITPLPYYSKFSMTAEERKEYTEIGEDIITKGKLAVITLAGGMGSRLGIKGPKGAYEIDVPPKKSLFEFICDKLKIASKKYGVYIPWYIMTSPSNNEKTQEFFLEHNYFEYPKEKVYFFTQNTINILDINGKIMLDSIGTLKKDSNGNGDIFKSFIKHKLEKTLENIEWISISGVDNILLEIVDPLFIGLSAKNNSNIASKSVRKEELKNKHWVFANVDGKPDIINPAFLTDSMCYSKNKKNQYNYNQSNILAHLFKKDVFLECAKLEIPYHRAFKKTDFINEEGMKMVVKEPNSFKFEKFIFDVFKYFDNFTLLEIDRLMEFAPIKAFTGTETPEIALEMYLKKCKRLKLMK